MRRSAASLHARNCAPVMLAPRRAAVRTTMQSPKASKEARRGIANASKRAKQPASLARLEPWPRTCAKCCKAGRMLEKHGATQLRQLADLHLQQHTQGRACSCGWHSCPIAALTVTICCMAALSRRWSSRLPGSASMLQATSSQLRHSLTGT